MSQGPSVGTVFFVSALTSALVSAGTVYGLRAYEGSTPSEEVAPTSVEVPELIGLSKQTARDLLHSRGLRLLVDGEKEHPTVALNHVMEQNPLGGSEVTSGDEVHVSISSGIAQVEIPNIVGQQLEAGRAAITKLGLTVTVTEDGEGTPSSITKTVPAAGEKVDAGSSITISAVPAGIVVPDLAGKGRRTAKELLTAAKLKLGKVRRRFDDRKPDLIILKQEPEAGARVPEGTEIEITINE